VKSEEAEDQITNLKQQLATHLDQIHRRKQMALAHLEIYPARVRNVAEAHIKMYHGRVQIVAAAHLEIYPARVQNKAAAHLDYIRPESRM